jgi:hypothetical protein
LLVNNLLSKLQVLFSELYKNSFILKNLDNIIFVNIILLILSFNIASSDNIGYFAMSMIMLTIIKSLFKQNTRFEMTLADKVLLIYFLLVLISVAGSSLFVLSLKGFLKTIIYLGFYISFIHFLQDNKSKLKYILLALAISLFGESLIALKQNFLSVSEISGWQDMSRLNPEEVMTRVLESCKIVEDDCEIFF